MMFIESEDYNFLAYNLLILLDEMKCYNKKRRFKDFRKIAYLIDFISGSADLDKYEKFELSNIYLKAQLKKKLLSHLIITLQNRGFLDISLNTTHKTIELWLNKENIPHDFFDKNKFEREISNIKKLKKELKITRVSLLKKLVDDIFTTKGVSTWEV
ncbi:MAG: hypothetical protein U9Q83_08215 [Bacteroidota bacterium]|nr:hypothetical protein [Bacteroidota bacterium]